MNGFLSIFRAATGTFQRDISPHRVHFLSGPKQSFLGSHNRAPPVPRPKHAPCSVQKALARFPVQTSFPRLSETPTVTYTLWVVVRPLSRFSPAPSGTKPSSTVTFDTIPSSARDCSSEISQQLVCAVAGFSLLCYFERTSSMETEGTLTGCKALAPPSQLHFGNSWDCLWLSRLDSLEGVFSSLESRNRVIVHRWVILPLACGVLLLSSSDVHFHDGAQSTGTGDEVSAERAKAPEAPLNSSPLAALSDQASRQSALGAGRLGGPCSAAESPRALGGPVPCPLRSHH